jgi:signal peptidase I
MKATLKFLLYFAMTVAFLAILGRIFLFEVGRVGNYSMVPNLIPGDIFLMRKVGLLGTGDIAVCPNPENPGELVVGRIIGVPGDTLRIKKNRLNINERQIHYQFIEPIIYFDNTTEETMEYVVKRAEEKLGGTLYTLAFMDISNGQEFRETTVPDGQFFLLGDNRNMAYDSRNFGFVPIDSCLGEAVFLLWTKADNGDLKQSARVLSWLH